MLRVEREGPVLRLTIDRPQVRNAFDDELIDRLTAEFVAHREKVRVVILSGAGGTFCAGGDLAWMRRISGADPEANRTDSLRLAALFQEIVDFNAVVIARVEGSAFGGGCGLVAASDVAIAAETAQFAFSEVRLGLVPATISPYVIPKIGHGNARALFATGEAFSAQTALGIGLVHKVVALDAMDAAVDATVAAVLRSGPSAVAVAKQIAQRPPMSMADSADLLAKIRSSDEAREGLDAFLSKRTASFVVKQ